MADQIEARLDRIEAKLDRLSEALVALARAEEKLITVYNKQSNYDAEQRVVVVRLAELEKVIFGRGSFFKWMDRAGVAAIGGAVATVINYLADKS